MAYLDETPWHGLGQNLLREMQQATPASYVDVALDAAQMRYSVGSVSMHLADGTEVPGHKVSVRFNPDGTVAATFGPVGEGYKHIQNEEAVSILRVLAEEFGCVPAAAGVLGNGERCWMLMRLANATITPVAGDDVRGYFLLHWDHTGNMTVQGLGTGVRVVCQNTLQMAISGRKAWIAIRHTTNASQRLDEAAGIVRKLMATLQATGETFAQLAARSMGARELAKYIEAVIPNTDAKSATIAPVIQARRDTIARLVFAGRGAALANQLVNVSAGEASLWAAYNAVTEYFDHVRPAEAKSDAGRINAQTSAVFGGNNDAKAFALDVARQLVAA
jgi:phage/plasmid-like protein (TIGR03299 family)